MTALEAFPPDLAWGFWAGTHSLPPGAAKELSQGNGIPLWVGPFGPRRSSPYPEWMKSYNSPCGSFVIWEFVGIGMAFLCGRQVCLSDGRVQLLSLPPSLLPRMVAGTFTSKDIWGWQWAAHFLPAFYFRQDLLASRFLIN